MRRFEAKSTLIHLNPLVKHPDLIFMSVCHPGVRKLHPFVTFSSNNVCLRGGLGGGKHSQIFAVYFYELLRVLQSAEKNFAAEAYK